MIFTNVIAVTTKPVMIAVGPQIENIIESCICVAAKSISWHNYLLCVHEECASRDIKFSC